MPMLAERERQRMLEVVLDETNGRVPVIAGASDAGMRRTLAQIELAARVGVQYAHILPPHQLPLGLKEVESFYRRLAQESSLPFVIYHNPAMTRITFSPEMVAGLAGCERIAGMKDSGGDLRFFQSLTYMLSSNPQFSLLQGSDQLVYLSQKLGGDGVIASLAAVAPAYFRSLLDAIQAGDERQAAAMQEKIVSLARLVYSSSSPIGAIKYLLHCLDLCPLRLADPYPAIDGSERARLRQMLQTWRMVPE
jgi:4-hydroxy-tetrahydrodipicolinate synthase